VKLVTYVRCCEISVQPVAGFGVVQVGWKEQDYLKPVLYNCVDSNNW
jgi:hypothetical protein